MTLPRVAYVHLTLAPLAGVQGAIAAQARAAREAAVPMRFVVVGPQEEREIEAVRVVRWPTPSFARLAELERRLFKYRLLARSGAFDDVDVALLRYVPAVDLDPTSLFRCTRARIVTVHHTKEAVELLSAGWTPGNVARAMLEAFGSRRVLERVHGIVGVTDEIRDYELGKLRRPKPAATVSNGILVDAVPATGFARPDADEMQMIFVASAHAPWHGTDRLLAGCERYRGRTRLVLHMVGRAAPVRAIANPRVRLVWHGERRGPDLDAIFARCSVAISSLAMHRVGLRQGAVLKTREYVARGIPFVHAYEDVDIPIDAPFALRLPGDDTPIDLERVVEHARRAAEIADLSARMRAFAQVHLDWRVKVQRLHAFAVSLC